MAWPSIPWPEIAGGLLSGSLLTQAVAWWNGRNKRDAYTMGAVDHAVQTAMKLVTDRLEKVEDQHAQCEADLSAVRIRLDGAERERSELRAEIDRMMAGGVASYGAKP